MDDCAPQKLNIGGDPRAYAEYASLCYELNKLTHPARPDVNWHDVETHCLSLFDHNGLELQTAAWYTVARLQLQGLLGLNEGLAIVAALIHYQWGVLWPQSAHARIDILCRLSQRLQQQIRLLILDGNDLGQLYRAEQLLSEIDGDLQRLELKHLSQFEGLRALIHHSAVRLENSTDNSATTLSTRLKAPTDKVKHTCSSLKSNKMSVADDRLLSENSVQRVFVVQSEPINDFVSQTNIEILSAKSAISKGISMLITAWKPFVAGACSMLILSASIVFGGWLLFRVDPLQMQLTTSLSPLPQPLDPMQSASLVQHSRSASTLIAETEQQLVRLESLPPDWSLQFAYQLIEQARIIAPHQVDSVEIPWRRSLNANALPLDHLNGWHQGMERLQKLSDRLNHLDEQKGKYMTVSELKSEIFSTMHAFNQTVPAEEHLRRLLTMPAGKPLPTAAITRLEMHLKQLLARYALIKQPSMLNEKG